MRKMVYALTEIAVRYSGNTDLHSFVAFLDAENDGPFGFS